MKPLRIPRHEKFAQLLAAGETQSTAYRLAYRYSGTTATANKLAQRLAARPDISARVEDMQQRAAKKVDFSLRKRLDFLMDAILTPPDQITSSSPLCLGTRLTPHGVELKLIDKKAAIELYSKLAGDFKDRPDVAQPTPLGQIISRIRARQDP
ncbi:hypothetical protein BH09VER1_BH09VER1_16260 [soil metagenome]